MSLPLTETDLRSGKRIRLSDAEFRQLTGESRSTTSRHRWAGIGPAFRRDALGRIWYDSSDVIAYLDSQPKFRSTSEYQHDGNVRMARARAAKANIAVQQGGA